MARKQKQQDDALESYDFGIPDIPDSVKHVTPMGAVISHDKPSKKKDASKNDD